MERLSRHTSIFFFPLYCGPHLMMVKIAFKFSRILGVLQYMAKHNTFCMSCTAFHTLLDTVMVMIWPWLFYAQFMLDSSVILGDSRQVMDLIDPTWSARFQYTHVFYCYIAILRAYNIFSQGLQSHHYDLFFRVPIIYMMHILWIMFVWRDRNCNEWEMFLLFASVPCIHVLPIFAWQPTYILIFVSFILFIVNHSKRKKEKNPHLQKYSGIPVRQSLQDPCLTHLELLRASNLIWQTNLGNLFGGGVLKCS